MKKVATKNFTSQIDQIIERHKALLDTEWQKLISQSSAGYGSIRRLCKTEL